MKKNFFILLVTLMIVSLVAVIMVQAYWINSAFENKEEEFSLAVSQSLQSVSKKVGLNNIEAGVFLVQWGGWVYGFAAQLFEQG